MVPNSLKDQHESAYGESTVAALTKHSLYIKDLCNKFSAFLNGIWSNNQNSHVVIMQLQSHERLQLCKKLSSYLHWCLTTDIEPESHQARAEEMGRVHALIGVEIE